MNTDKTFFTIIIALPILDIMTTFTANFAFSIGAIIRTLAMALLFIYLVYFYINKNLALFLIPFLSISITFILNFLVKNPFLLQAELQFLFKTAYYIVMIYIAIVMIQKQQIHVLSLLRATSYASIIFSLSYWIAILTKTSISSYSFVKVGYSGWFYAANELSVILLILLALTIVHIYFQPSPQPIIAYVLLLFMTPMIGTKTAFYGGMIIVFTFLIFAMFTLRQKIPFIAITILFLIFLPLTPFADNQTMSNEVIEQSNDRAKSDVKMEQLLSSRDAYVKKAKEDFLAASSLRQVFGLGYAGDYHTEPKMIEMDFYELFFSYGIIGTIFLLLPLILLVKKMIVFRFSVPYFILLLTCGLCIGIAFVAGHVLFAPAVMSYIAILAIVTGIISKESREISLEGKGIDYRSSL